MAKGISNCHKIENMADVQYIPRFVDYYEKCRPKTSEKPLKTSGDREPFKNFREVFHSNVVLSKRTTFENLKPLKNHFENLLRIFEFQETTVIYLRRSQSIKLSDHLRLRNRGLHPMFHLSLLVSSQKYVE